MRSHARWLFGAAAVFNFTVAAGLLFLRPWLVSPLHLEPATGSNLIVANATGVMIATFGYAYALVAANPARYHPYVQLGIIGKLLVMVGALWPWLNGAVDWRLPALSGIDFLFTLLFLDYLRRARLAPS
jgi:hypothetical protein